MSKVFFPNTLQWLLELSAASIKDDTFPLTELLTDSLYYPCSSFDGDPVRYFSTKVQSFVYVDYGNSRAELDRALRAPGFRGYTILATREVNESELAPHGWQATPTMTTKTYPAHIASFIKPPFCTWIVLQRCSDMPAEHGPERISLLYLCADAIAAFHALYVTNTCKPSIVAVIQPGHGFGGNWTNLEEHNAIFAELVLQNPAGLPDTLLFGGIGPRDFYRKPCWPKYAVNRGFIDKSGGGSIGVWEKE